MSDPKFRKKGATMTKAERLDAVQVLQRQAQTVEVAIDQLEYASKSELEEVLDEIDDELETLTSDVADFRREVT